jgi:TolB-like protein
LGVAGSNKAVFLSYAKEDAAAAAKICAALRASGIEVWFDQSELRGGDAWDSAIRRQIKTCALVIPVISANTQGRAEGYFRLEWKLAVDRSHLMSHDRPFLVPVVIDQTPEEDERVPDKFRDVQWSRLLGGETPPAFSARVLNLLESGGADNLKASVASATAVDRPSATSPESAPASSTTVSSKSRTPVAALAAALVLLCIGIAWASRHHWMHSASVVPYSSEDRRMTYAVLPFQAAADDAQGLKIAKGTGDEILTLLQSRRDIVTVVPEASAQEAAKHETGIKKLAQTLDVHFLVRGNVARSGSGYTVTVVGIDGASERVLATKTLSVAADALTPRWRDDVQDVAGELTASGVEAEVKRSRDRPVDALDVRDLTFRASVDWGLMRDKDGKQANAMANDLLNKALATSPDDLYALRTKARINLCDCVNSWSPNPEEQKSVGAEAMDRYLRMEPTSRFMLSEKASLYQLRLRWEESLIIADSMLTTEPESASALGIKAAAFLHLRKLSEAREISDGLLTRYPTWWGAATLAGDVAYAQADYTRAAQLAQQAVAQMSDTDLRDRGDGAVRLTLIASAARLGQSAKAKGAWTDFTLSLPKVKTIDAIKKWIEPSADLADFEPLYDGLRMAGISN